MRNAPWTHMVPTHRTTVLLSNVFHLMSFQRATQIAAACVKHTHPITRTAFLLTFAFARCGRLGHLLCAEKAHGVESAVVEGGGVGGFPPPKQRSYTWSYFRKLLILWAGRERVWRLVSCTSAVAGSPDDGRAAVKQLACSRPRFSRAP